MRIVLCVAALAVLSTGWLLRANPPQSHCLLRIELVDAQTGEPLAGLVKVTNAQGQRLELKELLPRGLGLPAESPIQDWSVLTKPTAVKLPPERVRITAFSGLETEFAHEEIDLTGKAEATLRLKLKHFSDVHSEGYRNANTHVHLMKVTRAESDRYLMEAATADGLDLVFVSYLERAEADVDYITNRYSRQEIQALSNKHVHFDNGQEHRHNFGPGDEGYGHVMLLNIPEKVYPVSIGPGISKVGTDGIPIQRGIERAREMGGTVIWCHNKWGLEDIPNWLSGRRHANNIFDGGTHGSYQHSFYRYWDIGLKVPVSTGTDWFIYDFSRVYAKTNGNVTPAEWLKTLAESETYITNGPLLEFTADGQAIGGEVGLSEPKTVRIKASAKGRMDFEKLELVQNGQVIHTVTSKKVNGHYEAAMEKDVRIDAPCWLAVRTPPPSAGDVPGFTKKTPKNEYGQELFSHTSPIFVTMKDQRPFSHKEAESLLKEMQDNRLFIAEKGLFADETERRQVLEVYDEGIEHLRESMKSLRPGSQGPLD
jgi:hypothetical protein